MKKKNETWIYRIILTVMVMGSVVTLGINGIQKSTEKRIQAFDLTEGKDGVYFSVQNQVYEYKPEEDLLIELSGSEKVSALKYIKAENDEKKKNVEEFYKDFFDEQYTITNVICYKDFILLTVSYESEEYFYKVFYDKKVPICLTNIVNAPSQAIARFEDKIYYVTDEIGLSNKFVCCNIETGEITQLKGYPHRNGMVELIVKEDCLYYTTSPYSYVDGGLMYFNFETKENRLIYSNVK